MIDWSIYLEPFFVRAIIGGIIIATIAPLLGLFLVLRRLAMIGDTLAHIAIAGVALGLLIGAYPLLVGLIFAVIGSLAIEFLRKAYRSYAELSLAILMSTGIAFATFLFTMGRGFTMNVTSYLFGSIYTLSRMDLYVMAGIAIMVIGLILLLSKELFLVSFDEDAAQVSGLPVRWINLMLTVLAALVIGSAIKIVGALLVSGLLVIPVAISLVIGRSFKQTLWIAIGLSQLSMIIGLFAAGVWNLAPGSTVVLFSVFILAISLALKRVLRF